MENKRELISVIAQAFYGNRVGTTVAEDEFDGFVLGYLDNNIDPSKKIDRTIIRLPKEDNLVLVYNKYAEQKELEYKEKVFKEEGYVLKPLATIEEMNLELYSRCIACRVDENGNLASLEKGDYEKVIKYLA